MKKKIIMGLFVLTAVIGMGFAENKICKIFNNSPNGGITVVVEPKNIKIMSNGNKMRITDCKTENGRRFSEAIGKIIEEYGEITVKNICDSSSVKIIVTAEGCN